VDIKEQIAVMQGFADGKEVEFKLKSSSCWNTSNRGPFTPVWNWHECEYRIKPEPPIQVEFWGIVSIKENKLIQAYRTKSDALGMCNKTRNRVIKLLCTEVPENAA